MDDQDNRGVRRGNDVRRALAVVSTHPAVSNVGTPRHDHKNGATSVDVTFKISLPSEWRRCGHSPSGVRSQETVRFHFPIGFPLESPGLSLRPDFNRNLPHMQPWLSDGRPVPCVYDGDLTELILRDGLAGLVNQTAVWLERAALGTLIDPDQGWEPVRRDSYRDHVIADADGLRRLVNRNGGYKFLRFDYLRTAIDSKVDSVHGLVSTDVVSLTPKTTSTVFRETLVQSDIRFRRGRSVALVVWPGKRPSGSPIVSDTYLPETVTSVDGLKDRAHTYGCGRALKDGLRWLAQCLANEPGASVYCFGIILLARRPYNVIGSRNPMEICPYVLDVVTPSLFANGEKTPVRPAGHRRTVSRSLLSELSGANSQREHPYWTLVGAGSLGSKLALHLARAGNGPDVVIDKAAMTPHNAARHALIPATGDMHVLWMQAKAALLCDTLRGLDHRATPMVADVRSILASKRGNRRPWAKRPWAIVNATASLAVREAFAYSKHVPARVIETLLFSRGRVGIMTVEGPNRNPNTNDLMAECYALLAEEPTWSRVVFGADDAITLQNIGQGCGSMTMVMSDGRISLFAAGIAEYLLHCQVDGLPSDSGAVLIGRLSNDGLGLEWQTATVPPVTRIRCKAGAATWHVHIHQRAASKIAIEVDRCPSVETGGVIMGRLSEVSRTVHVVDVLHAPEDSTRSPSCFVLGTSGLRERIEEYSSAVGWSLYCLGTWHSHLEVSGPSATDRATASAVAVARLSPSVALIETPAGFSAFLADPEDVLSGSR